MELEIIHITVCLVRWFEPTRTEPTYPSQCLDGRQEGWVGSTVEYSLKMRVRFLPRNLRDGADPLGFRPLSVFFRRLPNSALRRHYPPPSPPPSLRASPHTSAADQRHTSMAPPSSSPPAATLLPPRPARRIPGSAARGASPARPARRIPGSCASPARP